MLRTVIAATAAAGLVAGCAPDSSAPVKVNALVLTSNGEYAPQEVELKTITDIVSLNGTVADFRGGARIVLDSRDQDTQTATTPEAVANAILKDAGHDVTASYIEKDGVLWPADFHTWNMVTAYYNMERAVDYFRTVGNLPGSDFEEPIKTYYFAEFVLADQDKDPQQDNALYFPILNSFLVLPFDELQRAPLAINAGIIAHEYSHRVFNLKAYNNNPVPEALTAWLAGAGPGANVLKSFDEGLADLHAYGTTCKTKKGCDPRFFSTSFHGDKYEQVSVDRDLSRTDRCMTLGLRTQLQTLNFNQFAGKEYEVGTLLASALFQAGEATGQRDVLLRAIVASYNDTNPQTPGLYQLMQQFISNQNGFTLAVASSAIISHVTDPRLKEAVCNELMDHLQIPREQLQNVCPASAAGGSTCPRLPVQ